MSELAFPFRNFLGCCTCLTICRGPRSGGGVTGRRDLGEGVTGRRNCGIEVTGQSKVTKRRCPDPASDRRIQRRRDLHQGLTANPA